MAMELFTSVEIPGDPTVTSDWTPVTIETGDPNLVMTEDVKTTSYRDPAANGCLCSRSSRGPYYQGSPGIVRAEDLQQ